jgi:plasmid stabilization system protein ParE
MALPVELDPRAEREAREAFTWYLERSERAAAAFEREIERALIAIGESPATHPIVDGVHRYLLDRFPYSLHYAIHVEAVVVLAVAHQHRRPGYWASRHR